MRTILRTIRGNTRGATARSLTGLALLATVFLTGGCGVGGDRSPASDLGAPALTAATQAGPLAPPPGPPNLADWQGRLAPLEVPNPSPLPSPPPPPEFQTWGDLDLHSGWNMVSLPVAEVTSLQVGTDVLPYAFYWDAEAQAYLAVNLGDTASLATGEGTGRGFWVYANQASTLGYVGWPNQGSHRDPDVNLAPGWNLLGFPYGQAQAFWRIQVAAPKDTGTLQALPNAVSQALPPGQDILLFGSGYTYGDQVYQTVDLSAPAGSFQPGQATWVYAYRPDTLWRYGPSAQETLRSCKANLMAVAMAAEIYATDYAGRYPYGLSDLARHNYLAALPSCPAAGTDTYQGGYSSASNPSAFTVRCQGANHLDAGVPADFPMYTSTQGLVDR